MIYLASVQPQKTKFANKMDLFVEFTVMVITYHLICFSDAGPDLDTQYSLGWSYVGCIFLVLLVNMFFIVKDSIRMFYLRMLLRYLKWKAKHAKPKIIDVVPEPEKRKKKVKKVTIDFTDDMLL